MTSSSRIAVSLSWYIMMVSLMLLLAAITTTTASNPTVSVSPADGGLRAPIGGYLAFSITCVGCGVGSLCTAEDEVGTPLNGVQPERGDTTVIIYQYPGVAGVPVTQQFLCRSGADSSLSAVAVSRTIQGYYPSTLATQPAISNSSTIATTIGHGYQTNVTCSNTGGGTNALSYGTSDATIYTGTSIVISGVETWTVTIPATTVITVPVNIWFVCNTTLDPLTTANLVVTYLVNALPTIVSTSGGTTDIVSIIGSSPPIRNFTCSHGTPPYSLNVMTTGATIDGGILVDSSESPVFAVIVPIVPTATMLQSIITITCMDSTAATSSSIAYSYYVHRPPVITVPAAYTNAASVLVSNDVIATPSPSFNVTCRSLVHRTGNLQTSYSYTYGPAQLTVSSSDASIPSSTIIVTPYSDAITYHITLPSSIGSSMITMTCNDTVITVPSSTSLVSQSFIYTVVPPINITATNSLDNYYAYVGVASDLRGIICGGGNASATYDLIITAPDMGDYIFVSRSSDTQFTLQIKSSAISLHTTNLTATCVDMSSTTVLPSASLVFAITIYNQSIVIPSVASPLTSPASVAAPSLILTCSGGLPPYQDITVLIGTVVPSGEYQQSQIAVVKTLPTASVTFTAVAYAVSVGVNLRCIDSNGKSQLLSYTYITQAPLSIGASLSSVIAPVSRLSSSSGNQTITCGGGSGTYSLTVISSNEVYLSSSLLVVRALSVTTFDIMAPAIFSAGDVNISVTCHDAGAATAIPVTTLYTYSVWSSDQSSSYTLLANNGDTSSTSFSVSCGTIGSAGRTSGITYALSSLSGDITAITNAQVVITGTSPSFIVTLPSSSVLSFITAVGAHGIDIALTCRDTATGSGDVIMHHTVYRYGITTISLSSHKVDKTVGTTGVRTVDVTCGGVNGTSLAVTSSSSLLTPIVVASSSTIGVFRVQLPSIISVATIAITVQCQALPLSLLSVGSPSWFNASDVIMYQSYASLSLSVTPLSHVIVSVAHTLSYDINVTCNGGMTPFSFGIMVAGNPSLQSSLTWQSIGGRSIGVTLPSLSVSLADTSILVQCNDSSDASLSLTNAIVYTVNDRETISVPAITAHNGVVNGSIGSSDTSTQVICSGGTAHHVTILLSNSTFFTSGSSTYGITVSPTGTNGVFDLLFPAVASLSSVDISVTCTDISVSESSSNSISSTASFTYRVIDTPVIGHIDNIYVSSSYAPSRSSVTCSGGVAPYVFSLQSSNSIIVNPSSVTIDTTAAPVYSFQLASSTSAGTAIVTLQCIDQRGDIAHRSFNYTIYAPLTVQLSSAFIYASVSESPFTTQTVTCGGGSGISYGVVLTSSNNAVLPVSSLFVTNASPMYEITFPSVATEAVITIGVTCNETLSSLHGTASSSFIYSIVAQPVIITSSSSIIYAVARLPPLITVNCTGPITSGTAAYYTITSTVGIIDRVTATSFTLQLPSSSSSIVSTSYTLTCIDTTGMIGTTLSSTYQVNDISIISGMTSIVNGSTGTAPATQTIRCTGGNGEASQRLSVTPSVVGGTAITITATGGNGVGPYSVSLPALSTALPATVITLTCHDTVTINSVDVSATIIYEVTGEDTSIVDVVTITDISGAITVTQSVVPSSFNVTCMSSTGRTISLTSSLSATTITLLSSSNVNGNLYSVTLPSISSQSVVVSFNCSTGASHAVSSLTYHVNALPTITLTRSAVVMVNSYSTISTSSLADGTLVDMVCSGGTAPLSVSVTIASADDAAVITSADINNFTTSTTSSGVNGQLLLPQRSIDSSATLSVTCRDSFGVTTHSSIVWCIGSSYDRCSSSCATWSTWSSCTSSCGSGVSFRTCTTPNVGTSNRLCNTAVCPSTAVDASITLSIGLTISVAQASLASFQLLLRDKLAAVGGITTARVTIGSTTARSTTSTSSTTNSIMASRMSTSSIHTVSWMKQALAIARAAPVSFTSLSVSSNYSTIVVITIAGRTDTSTPTASSAATKIAAYVFTSSGSTDDVSLAIDDTYTPQPVLSPYVAIYPDCPGFIVCSSGGSAIIVLLAIFGPFLIACLCASLCIKTGAQARDPSLTAKLKEIGVIDSAPMTPIPGSVPSPYHASQSLAARSTIDSSSFQQTELTSVAPVATLQVV